MERRTVPNRKSREGERNRAIRSHHTVENAIRVRLFELQDKERQEHRASHPVGPMKDRAYTVELHINIDLKEPARSQTGRYLTFIVQWHEQTHGGSVETLVQVNVIEPLDWA